ncbi:probable glutathione S-transferase isoform X4 [Diospyros lotus]|uniref:probable glutathione S-transferase isoform X4 n=1 Tax=Diospyros lotus TaxID=55363 RepID=UPI00225B0B68|nr:probable glutathione S-transferase isoform X4 [Diospyros lotus]
MESQEVKLLGFWVSPFVHRVEWALKLKGVPYEYIEDDIFNKSPLLLELNPVHKKVPVLVHNQKVLAESFVILEYIDENWKQCPLLPQDPYDRAKARFWAKFAEEKLFDAAWKAVYFKGDKREKALESTMEAVEEIEGQLKGKSKFFGGESIGYLDLALGWISYILSVWEDVGSIKFIDSTRFPATAAWMSEFVNHPVVKDSLPPRDKMIIYFDGARKKLEI